MIKFRVYDLKENKYVPNDADWLIASDGKLYQWDCDDQPEELSQKRFVVERGTGCKDKNDKEIYIGDILETCCGKAEVYFDDELLMCRLRVRHGGTMPLVGKKSIRHFDYEVIGNVHEGLDKKEEQ